MASLFALLADSCDHTVSEATKAISEMMSRADYKRAFYESEGVDELIHVARRVEQLDKEAQASIAAIFLDLALDSSIRTSMVANADLIKAVVAIASVEGASRPLQRLGLQTIELLSMENNDAVMVEHMTLVPLLLSEFHKHSPSPLNFVE